MTNKNPEAEILEVIKFGKIKNFNFDILNETLKLGKDCEHDIRRALQNLAKEGKIISRVISVNQWRNKEIYNLAK